MSRSFSPFDYPIVIKQAMGFITISVPDLGITVVESLPPGGRMDPKFLLKIANHIGRSWIKANEEIQRMKGHRPLPRPSSTKGILNPDPDPGLSTPHAAKVLGVHENTVRNLVEAKIMKCKKTAGGHRRFAEGEVLRVKALMDSGELKRKPGPRMGPRRTKPFDL